MAARTCTETHYTQGLIRKLRLDCVFDTSDGSFASYDLTNKMDGYLLAMETNPDGTPDPNYDIVLNDADGVDILLGGGANRHTTTTEVVALKMGTYFHPVVLPDQTYSLVITGNTDTSSSVAINLFYSAIQDSTL